MAIEIVLPALSPTMEEGTLARWLVSEGDAVKVGDVIAEIETDKATMELEAEAEGIIASFLVPAGTSDVKIGTVVALLDEASENAETGAETTRDEKVGGSPAGGEVPPADTTEITMPALSPTMEEGTLARWLVGEGDAVKAGDVIAEIETDKATMELESTAEGVLARLVVPAGTENVKVGTVIATVGQARAVASAGTTQAKSPPNDPTRDTADEGTGRTGMVPTDDHVASVSEAKTATPAAPAPRMPATEVVASAPYATVPLSGMRKTIARRLTEAKQQVPHIYLTLDIRIDQLLSTRAELNASLESRGVRLSVNDLLVKALAAALMEVPECNVQFAGDQILQFKRADISVAVSIPGGLITPVVTAADQKSASAISKEVKELAERAKGGKLAPHEYQGGTASISNMGMYGIRQFEAIINPPQAMILAIGAGEMRPAIHEGSLGTATIMTATGSFDHRAIDGADGARLMSAFKGLVEEPFRLLA